MNTPANQSPLFVELSKIDHALVRGEVLRIKTGEGIGAVPWLVLGTAEEHGRSIVTMQPQGTVFTVNIEAANLVLDVRAGNRAELLKACIERRIINPQWPWVAEYQRAVKH